jgi:hypothetical protein
MDDYLKSLIIDGYRDLAPDEVQREELAGMLEAMWQACREQRAFGYSDHQLAIVPVLPDLFRMVKPLIASKEDFQRFCRAMPAILKWMPYFSEESQVGYMHTIITGPFEDRARACHTLDEFVQGFEGDPISVCPECGKDATVTKLQHGYSVQCACGFLMVC